MSFAQVQTRALAGVLGLPVTVEVHLANGLPALSIVGLPETAVKEAKDRVRGALLTSGFEFPARRITINLAPADLPKGGGRFDLPIALGVLAASGQIPADALNGIECMGELALSGALRGVRGVLPAALAARQAGRVFITAQESAAEAALVPGLTVHPADTLLAVAAHLSQRKPLPVQAPTALAGDESDAPDMGDVRGQFQARRALEIAAAGAHNLLFEGPPGTGKTLLASCLPGILPPMTDSEALESAAVASLAGTLDPAHWCRRPFRAPHHTASGVALVGGGGLPRPGEVSLAHHGVLFLDELPEFSARVLEVLREPLESGRIVIARAARQAEFPARVQLVAAMNPCPCGYLGDPNVDCRCSPDQVSRYRGRISGPLLDRIDIRLTVPRLAPTELRGSDPGESSARVRERVAAARAMQLERQGRPNAQLSGQALERHCQLPADAEDLLMTACHRLSLSPRAVHRVLRVARTIADLAQSPGIALPQLSEALGYRGK